MQRQPGDILKVIQLTDTHLFGQVDSNQVFTSILKKMRGELADTDFILLTGDVSQDETDASYQYAADSLKTLGVPVYWLPGNHDDDARIANAFTRVDNFSMLDHLELPDWDVVFVDSIKPGDPIGVGLVSPRSLAMLAARLESARRRHRSVIIVMHHNAVPVGIPAVDHYMLQQPQAFLDRIANSPVRLVICGHVHGDFRMHHAGICFETGPAAVGKKSGYKIYWLGAGFYAAETRLWEWNLGEGCG